MSASTIVLLCILSVHFGGLILCCIFDPANKAGDKR